VSDSKYEQCWIITGTMVDIPPAGTDIERVRRQHHEYIAQLDAEGVLVVHGATRDENGKRTGTGMIVIRAENRTQADEIARREPYAANGVRNLELIPWQLQFGRTVEKH
jgi:uncharacterized protein YciI